MAGVAQLIASDGVLPGLTQGTELSPKRRGVYQGIFILLLGFLVVPILTMLAVFLRIGPFIPVAATLLFAGGTLLRIAYAVMFESSVPGTPTLEQNVIEMTRNLRGQPAENRALPPERSIPVDIYAPPAAGTWRDTNDLSRTPGSVTDSTTKLLQEEKDRQ